MSSQLSALTRWKKDKTDTTEIAKVIVLWGLAREALGRSRTLKSSEMLHVDEKSSSGNSLGLEVRGGGGVEEASMRA